MPVEKLYPHLVGAAVEYSDFRKATDKKHFIKTVESTRNKISKHLTRIFSITNPVFISAALGEMVNYYRNQSYWLSVKSAIELRRMKDPVRVYLHETPEDRQGVLLSFLKVAKRDHDREVIVLAISYFVKVYESRRINFKEFLTKEEYLNTI